MSKDGLAHRALVGDRHLGGMELETVGAFQVGSMHFLRHSSSDGFELSCTQCPLFCPAFVMERRFRHPHFRRVSVPVGGMVRLKYFAPYKMSRSSSATVRESAGPLWCRSLKLITFVKSSQRLRVISDLVCLITASSLVSLLYLLCHFFLPTQGAAISALLLLAQLQAFCAPMVCGKKLPRLSVLARVQRFQLRLREAALHSCKSREAAQQCSSCLAEIALEFEPHWGPPQDAHHAQSTPGSSDPPSSFRVRRTDSTQADSPSTVPDGWCVLRGVYHCAQGNDAVLSHSGLNSILCLCSRPALSSSRRLLSSV